ncbi:hypothetical protein [Streptomyces sp. BH055]|uniref:hypothetical protein n=1 Tax=unclassified Streptomyces TaxID=2593676 RepID=UPI003BB501D3
MSHHKHPHHHEHDDAQDHDRPAQTAVESVLDEFEEAEVDSQHRKAKDRRRGESGDALSPNPEAQEQAHDE